MCSGRPAWKSTLVLDQKSLKLYGGHFTQVMRQVSEQHAQAVAQNAQTVKRMDELASFVTRFKAKASKSKKAAKSKGSKAIQKKKGAKSSKNQKKVKVSKSKNQNKK